MKTISHKKNNGVYYTPPELANFVAKIGIRNADAKILDPCYGDGALLLAARERLLVLGSTVPAKQLYGYDIIPVSKKARKNRLQGLVYEQNLKERDFFSPISQGAERRFDVILMNPPFVRHHLIPKLRQKYIRSIDDNYLELPMTSDLWVYFLLHSLKFIKENGSLVAILPWSFLYADFAKPVRDLLLEKFRRLRVVVIGQRMFKNAEERILVLQGSGFGSHSSSIGIYYSFNVPKRRICWIPVDVHIWRASPWLSLVNVNIQRILSDVGASLGFDSLSRFAKIRIGTVTGANNFFILEREIAKRMKLPRRILKPIITHTRDLRKLTIDTSDDIKHVIMLIPEDFELPPSLKKHIKRGESEGLNKRYHTQKRVKWYSIPKQKPPDGFLHYMTKEVPFLVLNSNGLLSTNTVHQVEFLDGVDENTKKWIQFSMLTSISQVSVELIGRTYGGGILKIEPTAAGKIMVYAGNGHRFPKGLQEKVNAYLLKGKRLDAMKLADEWMITNLAVPKEDMDFIRQCYQNVRDIRLGVNR